MHLRNKGEVFLIFRKPSKKHVISSDWLNLLTKSSPDVEDLKILNRNLYWETDWKDFLTRSRSIAVTDIWVSSDSDFSRRKNPLFWPKIHILRRLVIFKNLFNSDDGDDFSTYKIKAKYVFYGLFYVFLFNLNIVLIFCFHSKKIVNERHEYLISHKRNLQRTFIV